MFEKYKSILVSEEFFRQLWIKLQSERNNLNGYYKVFNNCREQGYVLTLYDNNESNELLIWACESRNSDHIMVVIADRSCSNTNDLFNEDAYKKAKYFNCDDYYSATEYAMSVIKKVFDKNFIKSYENKFNMNRCLSDIERIVSDSKDLDYNDYYDLATFEDGNSGYFCDLIILDGKVGLRYSKYLNSYHDELDNLTFEEWHPDLTSDITLMMGMQNKLKDFVDSEIEYQIDNDIKI